MTISTELRKAGPFTGNGVTTAFPFSFKVFAATDVTVTVADTQGNESVLALGADYAVALNADQDAAPGGTVTLAAPLSTGHRLAVTSVVPNLQPTDITNNGGFYPRVIEDALDRHVAQIQQIDEKVARALKVSVTSPLGDQALPSPVAGMVVGWNETNDGFANYPAAGNTLLAQMLADGTANIGGQAAQEVANLRGDLAVAMGSSLVGFQQAGAGAVVRTAQDKMREAVSLTDFGAVTGVDDTALLQRAIDFIQANTEAELITVGGVSSSYAATLPKLRLPKARLIITSTINCPAYLDIDAEGTIIEQSTAGADIFIGEAYQWKIKGVIFVGGRHHIHCYNANADTSLFDFEDNEFHLSSDYAIKTSATGGWSHLSASLKIHGKTRFLKCRKVLDNCCDSAEVTCWAYIDKSNFAASSAAIRNYAPTSHPRLFLKNFFGVPAMGTLGIDRVANARWIDNYGSVYAAGSRFGGEDAGLSILWHFAPQPTAAPYLGYETVFDGCWLFAGPAASNDSGVVVLQGEVPQRISIKNCFGPSDVPFVVNSGNNVPFPAYFTTWEALTGKKAYSFFHVDILNNTADGTDGTVYGERIPDGLRSYVVGAKQTRVKRAASQSLQNGFVNTLVAFDAIESDNAGGFSATNPTRLVMPAGCTKMRITVSGLVAPDGTAKILAATLVDSGLSRISGDASLRGICADGDRFAFSADVVGAPGSYWHVNIQHNAAGVLDLLDCRVSTTPLDFVG